MIEIPEARVLGEQIQDTLLGMEVKHVVTNTSPHKFAWFVEDELDYHTKLAGKSIIGTESYGGLVDIVWDDNYHLVIGDGVSLSLYKDRKKKIKKNQLLIEFTNGVLLACSVQMYGGMWCYKEGAYSNPYHIVAREKPNPLSEDFHQQYFSKLIEDEAIQNKSLKAFLATEQRIPGLGNGVLQDILLQSKIHPKRKVKTLSDAEKESLFTSVKTTLFDMTFRGGRNTEKDLFGEKGGYATLLSKNTYKEPCRICGSSIIKQPYMGGSIYYCESCQEIG